MYHRINVIGYYSTILYDNLGIDGDRNLLVTSIYNVVGPIFNFFFIVFFLDKVGRKKPLIFGTIGISIALICEAALGSQVAGSTGSVYEVEAPHLQPVWVTGSLERSGPKSRRSHSGRLLTSSTSSLWPSTSVSRCPPFGSCSR
jgi:MFS family permease